MRENGEWTEIEAQQAIGKEYFVDEAAAFSSDGTAYFAGVGTDTKLISFDGSTFEKYNAFAA